MIDDKLKLETLDDRSVPAVGFAAQAVDAGSLPEVVVSRPDGSELARIAAYDPSFRGGVSTAVGEFDGNASTIEVVTGAGQGGGPHVKAFSVDKFTGEVRTIASFYAFDSSFRGGVNVAVGNLGDTVADEIIAAAGPGGGPHVKVYAYNPWGVMPFTGANGNFFAFDSDFSGGVSVAAGNLDGIVSNGDELIVGPQSDGVDIKVFDRTGNIASFAAFANSNGVRFGSISDNVLNVLSDDGIAAAFQLNDGGGISTVPLTSSQLLDFVGPRQFSTSEGLVTNEVPADSQPTSPIGQNASSVIPLAIPPLATFNSAIRGFSTQYVPIFPTPVVVNFDEPSPFFDNLIYP